MGKKIKIELTIPQAKELWQALDSHTYHRDEEDPRQQKIIRRCDRIGDVLRKALEKVEVV